MAEPEETLQRGHSGFCCLHMCFFWLNSITGWKDFQMQVDWTIMLCGRGEWLTISQACHVLRLGNAVPAG